MTTICDAIETCIPPAMPVIPAQAGIQRLCVPDMRFGRPVVYTSRKRPTDMDRQPCVYLLASDRNGTLYLGVTSNLAQRVWQHRTSAMDGFSVRYTVHRLVWLEMHETMESAIVREKRIKKWNRAWKIELIEATNPYWRDLWDDILV